MCMLTKEVQEYLKNSIQTVLKNVPLLGGFFSITMSENRTNCCSHAEWNKINCPRCESEKPAAVIAKTIEVMANAVSEVNPEVKFCMYRGMPEKHSELAEIIKNKRHLAIENYKIMQRNASVGYEAANHYYVSKTMLPEKIVQCSYLLGD